MRRRVGILIGTTLLAGALTGCATAAARSGGEPAAQTPIETTAPAGAPAVADAAAHEQTQAWLDAVRLPPEAVPADAGVTEFMSYTGWVCAPIAEAEAFWTIPGATVIGTANWLRENPPAGLLSTAGPAQPEDPVVDSTAVGYIPEVGSQEGIVYTVMRTDGGVAVRAEVAALSATAVCPTPPGGGIWGAPGQG